MQKAIVLKALRYDKMIADEMRANFRLHAIAIWRRLGCFDLERSMLRVPRRFEAMQMRVLSRNAGGGHRRSKPTAGVAAAAAAISKGA